MCTSLIEFDRVLFNMCKKMACKFIIFVYRVYVNLFVLDISTNFYLISHKIVSKYLFISFIKR